MAPREGGPSAADLNRLRDVVPGTAAAGRAVVLDAAKAIDALEVAALTVGGQVVDESSLALAGLTASAAELNRLDGIPAGAGIVLEQAALFTQTTGDGVYTATLPLPANSRIVDIGIEGVALWNTSGAASLVAGDDVDPDGFFLATDLKATDLLAGEVNNLEHPGGKAGAYIGAEQRNLFQAAARNIIGVVTAVGTGTTGRTRMYVQYVVEAAIAAVKV